MIDEKARKGREWKMTHILVIIEERRKGMTRRKEMTRREQEIDRAALPRCSETEMKNISKQIGRKLRPCTAVFFVR